MSYQQYFYLLTGLRRPNAVFQSGHSSLCFLFNDRELKTSNATQASKALKGLWLQPCRAKTPPAGQATKQSPPEPAYRAFPDKPRATGRRSGPGMRQATGTTARIAEARTRDADTGSWVTNILFPKSGRDPTLYSIASASFSCSQEADKISGWVAHALKATCSC